MSRLLSHNILYAAAAILWGLLTIAACDSAGRRAAMLAVLDEADSLNRNDIPITSDSLLREAVDYFDHHGTPNERLCAHDLLGCAYRDMGEAPRAIEVWQDAITCADTTAADCDYSVLARVYGHLALTYHQQLLFNYELEAHRQASRYEYLAGDTLYAIYEQKMCANVYLLQNKADSAEIVLSDAIRLYRQHGYDQEALQSSILLMHLYANNPERLPELKQLVERYDAECTLFDEAHELPPDKRLFYYYKGRAFEECMQLDSAEFYYRKVYGSVIPYTNLDPMYKGLLSVFTKRHQADSIAKYAQLYFAVNDSSIAVKDLERTAMLAASYNYNHSQHEAFENAKKANRRLYVVLLSIVVIGMIAALFFYRQYRKKKKVWEELEREYEEAKNRLSRIQSQLQQLDEKHKDVLNSLQKENAESQAVITMLNTQHEMEKEQLMRELRTNTERVEQLERQLKISQYSKTSHPFLHLGIVSRIKQYAKDSQRQLSENDLLTLADAVKDYFPDLMTDLDGAPTITPLAKNVCLLTMLNLKPGEIVNLLDISSSQVSNLRKDVNTALFNEKTTRTLYQNLSKRYKILSS